MNSKCQILEERVSELVNRKYAISVSNGTEALYFSLLANNITQGDEVLVTNFSWISTASCISMVGATPVFCDVDLETYHISMNSVRTMVSPKTKAIIFPHLFGSMYDTKELVQFCKVNNILLIEDACQAFGSSLNGVPAGSIGDVSTFSFNLNKVVAGITGGGMVLTDNSDVADFIRKARHHGNGEFLGRNSRMSEVDAEEILSKIEIMESAREERKILAQNYDEFFKSFDLKFQKEPEGLIHNHHKYTIRFNSKQSRDNVQNCFGLNIHYPKPISENIMYKNMKHRKDNCPNSQIICDTILTLPLLKVDQHVNEIYYMMVEKIFRNPDWANKVPKSMVRQKLVDALCDTARYSK